MSSFPKFWLKSSDSSVQPPLAVFQTTRARKWLFICLVFDLRNRFSQGVLSDERW